MSFFELEEESINSKNSLWTERYRPERLEEYIGNVHLKEKFASYLEDGDIPHLLLHGRAGSGKSTAAKMLVNTIKCDSLFINASDENNVDTIRNKVKGFASTMGFNPLKIIVLDEADYISASGLAVLRNLMETFSLHTRFILTCNYIERIIEPIQSRCQVFEVVPPSKKEIAIHMSKILQKEKVQFKPTDLVPIIDNAYPDIRKVINTCQLSTSKGVLKIDKFTVHEGDYKNKILDILKQKDIPRNKFINIRKTIANARLMDFTDMYRFLYDKIEDFCPVKMEFLVILILAESQYQEALVIDKEIQFMGCITRILDIIK